MKLKNTIDINWPVVSFASFYTLIFIVLSACTTNKDEELFEDKKKEVKIEIGSIEEFKTTTRALGDPNYSVDRILILPFKKTNESLPDNDANFIPDYSSAKQIDINSFPVGTMTMALTSSSTYKILAFGFKRTDYNVSDPNNPANTFSMGAAGTPVTLANFHLQPVNTVAVPEFFTTVMHCYNNGTLTGDYFKPALLNDISLKGNLTRIVSGLTVQVTNIPGYVTSVSLTAEQLVKAVQPIGATPTLWQTPGDGANRIINTQIPSSGTVYFSKIILPTTSSHSTKLYLDLKYGTLTDRYVINVPNVTNVSSSNSITFSPNQVVNISGNYNAINLGFILTTSSINLDDNNWDGLS